MSWLNEATKPMLSRVAEAKQADVFPFFRPFERIGPHTAIAGRDYVNFTSNDYLGLSQHPDVKRAAQDGIERYGTGLGSSRLQATSVRHEELETRLADWLGFEACAVFPSGYQVLVGVLSAFLDHETTVALDSYSHASILDGTFLAKGQYPELEEGFFRHNSARGLRRILTRSEYPKKLAVAEGLYSADGDIAPLAEFAEVCRDTGAALLVDDAHGVGVLGEHGRGACELHGVIDDTDILVGTLSKSFGSSGGFVCADRDVVEFIKLSARSFVFSASLPIAQVEAAHTALDLIVDGDELRQRLRDNQELFRTALLDLGFDLGESDSHICPIMVGDEELAMVFGARLCHEASVLMLPFVYPGVPLGEARLRCNLTAAHTPDDMHRAIDAVASIGRELGVLRSRAGSASA